MAAGALRECGANPAELRRALGVDPDLEVSSEGVAIRLGSEARAVCERAASYAAARQRRYLEEGHLLLALTDDDSDETAVLRGVGLDVALLRERVERRLPFKGPGT